MPHIKLKLVEGRDPGAKRRLVAAVTKAVCEPLPTTPDNVRPELVEIKDDLFSGTGQLIYDAGVDR